VVLVVRANSTSARLVEDAVARIGKERICGVILNRQKHLASSKYYYKYYYKKVKS
jgi:Mrp family chromosome partitioning ATPase